MDVSVVIVSKRGEKELGSCVESIKRQTAKSKEIIVVSDEPIAIKGIKNIVTKANRSEARNMGWKKAKSSIILFAEADSIFDKDWIKNIMQEFRKGADAVIDRRAVFNPKTFVQKCEDEYFNLRYSHYNPFNAWAFKKSVLKSVNGFDERLQYGEDRDLGKRLLKKGFKIKLADEAYQFHKGEPKTMSEVVSRAFRFGKEKANTYYRKYPDEAPVFDSVFIMAWLILVPLSLLNLWCLAAFFAVYFLLYLIFIMKLLKEKKGYRLKTKYLLAISSINFKKWFYTTAGFVYGKIRGKR